MRYAPSHLSGGRRKNVGRRREGVHGMLENERTEWNEFEEARRNQREIEKRDRPQSAPLGRREAEMEAGGRGGVRFHERDLARPGGGGGGSGRRGGKHKHLERCSETQKRWAGEKVVEKYGFNLCPGGKYSARANQINECARMKEGKGEEAKERDQWRSKAKVIDPRQIQKVRPASALQAQTVCYDKPDWFCHLDDKNPPAPPHHANLKMCYAIRKQVSSFHPTPTQRAWQEGGKVVRKEDKGLQAPAEEQEQAFVSSLERLQGGFKKESRTKLQPHRFVDWRKPAPLHQGPWAPWHVHYDPIQYQNMPEALYLLAEAKASQPKTTPFVPPRGAPPFLYQRSIAQHPRNRRDDY